MSEHHSKGLSLAPIMIAIVCVVLAASGMVLVPLRFNALDRVIDRQQLLFQCESTNVVALRVSQANALAAMEDLVIAIGDEFVNQLRNEPVDIFHVEQRATWARSALEKFRAAQVAYQITTEKCGGE